MKDATTLYIGGVVVLAGGLGFLCQRRYGFPDDWWALAVLALLGSLTWWLPSSSSDGRVHFTADNVVTLAAIPIIGPLGCGVVSLIMAATTRRSIPLRRRIFNMAAVSASTMLSGIAYDLAGGSFSATPLLGFQELVLHVGLPIVVADLALLLTNALLVAVVIWLSAGVPLQLQLVDMLTSSGVTQFAYGVIAFIIVVMWLPGGLGPVAVLVGLAPLAGARWALLQYGEERDARERALGALVTAIETRAPILDGHSGRVSALAGLMAQELGLGPREVADIRTAGLLHDLGRVVVAPGREGSDRADSAALRGAAMLQSLPFLQGASAVMEEVARAPEAISPPSIAADIVRVADEYDLLLHDAQDPVTSSAALSHLRGREMSWAESDRVLASLSRVVGVQDRSESKAHESP